MKESSSLESVRNLQDLKNLEEIRSIFSALESSSTIMFHCLSISSIAFLIFSESFIKKEIGQEVQKSAKSSVKS